MKAISASLIYLANSTFFLGLTRAGYQQALAITCQVGGDASIRVAQVEGVGLVELVQVALHLLAPHSGLRVLKSSESELLFIQHCLVLA